MPLREAIPVNVIKPTKVAIENVPPVIVTAITLPINANGILSIICITIRDDLKCEYNTKNIPKNAKMLKIPMSFEASCWLSNCPPYLIK